MQLSMIRTIAMISFGFMSIGLYSMDFEKHSYEWWLNQSSSQVEDSFKSLCQGNESLEHELKNLVGEEKFKNFAFRCKVVTKWYSYDDDDDRNGNVTLQYFIDLYNEKQDAQMANNHDDLIDEKIVESSKKNKHTWYIISAAAVVAGAILMKYGYDNMNATEKNTNKKKKGRIQLFVGGSIFAAGVAVGVYTALS